MKKAVLISIRPKFARSLLAGTKTAEVRRRFPDLPSGTKLFVYSSSPDRAILGTLVLDAVQDCSPENVWLRFRLAIDIEKSRLDQYLSGAVSARVLQVLHPRLWVRPVSLEDLRSELGLEPAQSYRYLTDAESVLLESLSNVSSFSSPALPLASAEETLAVRTA